MLGSADNRIIWQEGNIVGFNTICANLHELKLGLVIFSNEADKSSGHNLGVLANEILKGLDLRAISLP